MQQINTVLFEHLLNQIAQEHPEASEFILRDINEYETTHHFYYINYINIMTIAVEAGLLPEQYSDAIDALKVERQKVISNALVGAWVGFEGSNTELILEIFAPDNITLIRTLPSEDGEDELQYYTSQGHELVETEGLVIANVFFGENRATTIRLVLYPSVGHDITFTGSLYFMQNDCLLHFDRVDLTKLDGTWEDEDATNDEPPADTLH
uniref:hypothetical protein n=1 Tax=Thaumasiovibrio occultus TaxID=1891184 RepID=UPI000B354FCA|nr:hypothetical protein [Thaumasiovibrio occultus]